MQYDQYQRFATEEFVLQSGGVLCPQPGCGMGILADPECTRITCMNGCGVQSKILTHKIVIFKICISSMFSVDFVCKVITSANAKHLKLQTTPRIVHIMLIQREQLKLDGTKLPEGQLKSLQNLVRNVGRRLKGMVWPVCL